mgnify:CR=1 FL=1
MPATPWTFDTVYNILRANDPKFDKDPTADQSLRAMADLLVKNPGATPTFSATPGVGSFAPDFANVYQKSIPSILSQYQSYTAGLPKEPLVAPLAPFAHPTMDPLLSVSAIQKQTNDALAAANKAVSVDITNEAAVLVPQVKQAGMEARARTQSDAMARGMTGSSTERGSLLAVDAATEKMVSEGIQGLYEKKYPMALQEKQMIVDANFKAAGLTQQLRAMVGDEAFKSMSLEQQREIANKDMELKLKLTEIDMKFQMAMKQAEFAFTRAENEADRDIKRQEMDYLKSERQKEREGAWVSSLTSLAFIAGGAMIGGPAMMGMAAGSAGSGALMGGMLASGGGSNLFSNLFLMK